MLSFLIGILLYQLMLIGIVSVFTFAFMKKNKENYLKIGIFAIIFLVYFIMRILPGVIGFQNFELPWESRFLTIFSGILLYIIFKKHFSDSNYLKIKQDKQNLRLTILVSMIAIIGYFVIFYFRGFQQEPNIGYLIFVSIISILEEELYFRLIILGLLMSCLDKKTQYGKYIAVILSGFIFGFWHGTFYNFDIINIITNCIYGSILGWITIKHKSILIPAIVHMITNVLGYIITVYLITVI